VAIPRGSPLDRPVALRLDLRLRALRYRLRLTPAEIRALTGSLRPGDAAVDVGAHKGGYLYWLQARVGPTGQVIAFEPQPDLADYLRRAVAALGAHQVTVETLALSDRSGSARLWTRRGRTSCGATLEAREPREDWMAYPVPAITLDEYLAGRALSVRAIKCDVEGHELAVLRGAHRTLGVHRPVLLVESEARLGGPTVVPEVVAWLADLGYDGWFFRGRRAWPIRDFEPAFQRAPRSPGYVNNFLFRPRHPPGARPRAPG
jgi:FkbM family methyltransferase